MTDTHNSVLHSKMRECTYRRVDLIFARESKSWRSVVETSQGCTVFETVASPRRVIFLRCTICWETVVLSTIIAVGDVILLYNHASA